MKIFENYSLLDWNTFHLKAQARYFAEYDTVEELKELLLRFRDEDILHIGRGSNLIFSDVFDGLILHSNIKFIKALGGGRFCVGAGIIFDDLCSEMCSLGFGGIENLSYIPGEVGAAAVQNIGAYGAEIKDVISEVEAIEISTLQPRIFSREECKYAYRDSIFKNELKGKYIITAVSIQLESINTYRPHLQYGSLKDLTADATLQDIREKIISIRREKLPEVSELGSVGSFFKNPIISEEHLAYLQDKYPDIPFYRQDDGIKIPAAWLIERAGLKGATEGGVKVYEKQPLVLVNTGNATSDDVYFLSALIHDMVVIKFNISLEPEANFIYNTVKVGELPF